MGETLRPRLERLHDLSKRLNAKSDSAGMVVQGVEEYLNEVCRLGLVASVNITSNQSPDGDWYSSKDLVYKRFGPKFRLVIEETSGCEGNPESAESTLWANCPRELKLDAFDKLPALLDELI